MNHSMLPDQLSKTFAYSDMEVALARHARGKSDMNVGGLKRLMLKVDLSTDLMKSVYQKYFAAQKTYSLDDVCRLLRIFACLQNNVDLRSDAAYAEDFPYIARFRQNGDMKKVPSNMGEIQHLSLRRSRTSMNLSNEEQTMARLTD